MPLPSENSFSEMYKRYNSLTRTIRIENELPERIRISYDILDGEQSVQQIDLEICRWN